MHLSRDHEAGPEPGTVFDQFLAVDIRIGTIVAAEAFPEARKPAIKLTIDFSPGMGVERSSARITDHHDVATLVGRQVTAVVDPPARQIGPMRSEVLVLGCLDAAGAVVLIAPDRRVRDGSRMF